MKHSNFRYFFLIFFNMVGFFSCHKSAVNPVPATKRTGLYVLNAGLNFSGSSLTFYDYTTRQLTPDIYASVNGLPLGDGATDIKVYGSKIYLLSYSGMLILDINTLKLLKKHNFSGGAIGFYHNYAFIGGSNYVTVNDTTDLVTLTDTPLFSKSKLIGIDGNAEQVIAPYGEVYIPTGRPAGRSLWRRCLYT